MNKNCIFDQEHTRRFNAARQQFLSNFLPDLINKYQLKTALDVGCGIGFFANFLASLGLKTTAFDGRANNIAEAQTRYPDIEFHVLDVEDHIVQKLGVFDLVLCFGLLYHLENPFRAIRNLHALTGKILFVESRVTPEKQPVAALVDECQGQDQGLRHIAFIPSETCLTKMLYSAGFPAVYKLTTFPTHEEFRNTLSYKRHRTMLVASRFQLHSQLLRLTPNPQVMDLWQKGWTIMRRVSVNIPIYLPDAIYNVLRKVKRGMAKYDDNCVPVNLSGDRDIEWSWVTAQMPLGPGEALDFGPGGSYLGLISAQRGFNVTAVDIEPVQWPYIHPQLHFVQGDILKLPLPKEHFDLVINCSTVEHVGLVGRYGVTEDRPDGDLEAMAHLRELMKPGGVMLLTIPVGQDAIFVPLCRVYGKQRLPRLLEGYVVEKEEFWVKNQENCWVKCDKETALSFKASAGSWDPLQNVYALGCFVLRKPGEETSRDGGVPPSAR